MSERLPDDDLLAELAERWKASSPAPPERLEGRVLRALRAERDAAADALREAAAVTTVAAKTSPKRRDRTVAAWRRPGAWPAPAWAGIGALAALLLVGAMLAIHAATFVAAPEQADRLLVADALREAEQAQREHARAIARLQEIARPVLAKAADPRTSGEHAGRLQAFGNRLRFLDETIAEIDAFLQHNPGHAGARATLLAAYADKTEVLREVIALDQEITS